MGSHPGRQRGRVRPHSVGASDDGRPEIRRDHQHRLPIVRGRPGRDRLRRQQGRTRGPHGNARAGQPRQSHPRQPGRAGIDPNGHERKADPSTSTPRSGGQTLPDASTSRPTSRTPSPSSSPTQRRRSAARRSTSGRCPASRSPRRRSSTRDPGIPHRDCSRRAQPHAALHRACRVRCCGRPARDLHGRLAVLLDARVCADLLHGRGFALSPARADGPVVARTDRPLRRGGAYTSAILTKDHGVRPTWQCASPSSRPPWSRLRPARSFA